MKQGSLLIGALGLFVLLTACSGSHSFDCGTKMDDFSCRADGSLNRSVKPPSLEPLNKTLGLSGADELIWWNLTDGKVHPFASLWTFTSKQTSESTLLTHSGGYGGYVWQEQTPSVNEMRFGVWVVPADSPLDAVQKIELNLKDDGLSKDSPGITKGTYKGFPAYWRVYDGPAGTTTVALYVATPNSAKRFSFVAPTKLRNEWLPSATWALTTVDP